MALDLDRLEEILEKLVDRLGGITSSGGSVGGTTTGAAPQTKEEKAQSEKVRKQNQLLDDTVKSLNKWKDSIEKGRKKIVDIGPAIQQLTENIEDLDESLVDKDEYDKLVKERNAKALEYLSAKYKEAGEAFAKVVGKTLVSGVWNGTKTLVRDLQSGSSGIQLASDLMQNALDANQSVWTGVAQGGKELGTAMMFLPGPLKKIGVGLSIASDILGTFTQAVTNAAKEGVQLLAAEADKTIKAFNNTAAAGALLGKGMDDVRKYATRAGLTVDQFSEVIKNNSQALADSGLTVEMGARAVADVSSRLAKDTGKSGLTLQREMLNLGVGFQEQADLVAQVMVGYKRAGMTATNKELATATVEMAKNTKAMADIMGEEAKNRQEAAKQQAAQYAFAAKINELAKKYGDPTLPMKVQQSLALMSESQRNAAIQATVLSGAVTDTGALLMDGGDAARTFAGSLESGKTSIQDLTAGTTRLNDRLQSGTDEMGRALSASAIAIGANTDLNKAYSDQYADSFKVNSANVDKAIKDADKLSGAHGGLQDELMGVEVQAQSLKMVIQDELTPTMKKFAKVADEVLGAVHKAVGAVTGHGFGGGLMHVLGSAGSGALTGGEFGGAAGAVGGLAAGGVGAVPGAIIGGGVGAVSGAVVGGLSGIYEAVTGQYDAGGIASGPVSGFAAELHGTEAVVPLPDGKTIPVETRQVGPSMDTKLMSDMLNELKNGHQSTIQAMNELVRHAKTTASYSSQLVQLAS